MSKEIKSDKLFKLFLMLVWEYKNDGHDWDAAEIIAWEEANDYFERFKSETNLVE